MTKHYRLEIDALRIAAILAVVMIHTTIISMQTAHHDITLVPFTFFLNQMAIFAVPLFFLISGFVLELNYQKLNYFSYFKKRASRIIIPYIFWSFFYYLAYPATIPKHTSFFSLLLTGGAAYQLYFIPAIILLYLFFPYLHTNYAFVSQKKVILPLLLLEIILQTLDYFFGPFPIGSALRVLLLSFVLFPLGMISSHHQEKIRAVIQKHFWIFISLLIMVISGVFTQSFVFYQMTHNLQAIYSQYQPLVIPYTLILAGIFFYAFSTEKYKGIIMRLSKLSFFVFLIHVAIIYTFWNTLKPLFIATQASLLGNLFFSLFFFFFVTILSFLLADLFHRIPKLSKITG